MQGEEKKTIYKTNKTNCFTALCPQSTAHKAAGDQQQGGGGDRMTEMPG